MSAHVASGNCPGCGGMNPARYARMLGRVKCSWVGCPLAWGHLGRHAPGSRAPEGFAETLAPLGARMGAALAIDAHFHALFWASLAKMAESREVTD